MSHDLYASWVTAELAKLVKSNTDILFDQQGVHSDDMTSFANRESGRVWPIPDGRITLATADIDNLEIAIELKRTNEGLHGVLTAVGQAQAYLKKGYDISIIVVPDSYSSYESPGNYICELLNHIDSNSNIVVVSYGTPDDTQPSPFSGKLTIHRNISFSSLPNIGSTGFSRGRGSQQWAHLREGSSDADVFFRYLQTSKFVSASNGQLDDVFICDQLLTACSKMQIIDPEKYLSFSPNDAMHDKVWRRFWFDYVLTSEVQNLVDVDSNGEYSVVDSSTKLKKNRTEYKKFFVGRADSIKNKIADFLNSHDGNGELIGAVNNDVRVKIRQLEEQGILDISTLSKIELSWIAYAINIRNRAHSFREDIDSGLEHIAMLESDGRPSELGYRFIDLCERTNDCYTGKPFLLFGAAILYQGQLASFLHYLYRISEQKFRMNPLEFSTLSTSTSPITVTFEQDLYFRNVLEVMVNELCVMNASTLRGGAARKPFQAEMAVLSKLGLISDSRTKRFRTGVGLVINWPKLSEYELFS